MVDAPKHRAGPVDWLVLACLIGPLAERGMMPRSLRLGRDAGSDRLRKFWTVADIPIVDDDRFTGPTFLCEDGTFVPLKPRQIAAIGPQGGES